MTRLLSTTIGIEFPHRRGRLSNGFDNMVKLWDVEAARELATLAGHTGIVIRVAFSPDGTMLASGSFDDTVKLWDARTGRELATLAGHTETVFRVAFSPDRTMLASGSYDDTVKLWDLDATGVPKGDSAVDVAATQPARQQKPSPPATAAASASLGHGSPY